MLHFCYLLMFWCLLRYDEALNLEFHQVEMGVDEFGIHCLEIRLPHRKTHQTGGQDSTVCNRAHRLTIVLEIAPFYLYEDPDPYLCPLFAYSAWCSLLVGLGETLRGQIFRKPFAGGVFSGGDALVCVIHTGRLQRLMLGDQKPGQFLDFFRHNLMDVGLDPRPYGTHSFRRGGAQFLHFERRWSIVAVCNWGGWSKDLEAQCTVFKYLLSWNDTSHGTRKQMLHPLPPLSDHCKTCNRNCNCY
jgi:hypothetical protein